MTRFDWIIGFLIAVLTIVSFSQILKGLPT